MFKDKDLKFYGASSVGARGQIVIPSKARKDLNINSGDDFVFFSHGRALNLVKASQIEKMLEEMNQNLIKKTKQIRKLIKTKVDK